MTSVGVANPDILPGLLSGFLLFGRINGREFRRFMMRKLMTVKMPDGSVWGVPVSIIARSRAAHYASEFDGDVMRSLAEDTLPLFEEDDYAIEDWAKNNMNWSDFDGHQVRVYDAPPPDFQGAWMNGDTGYVDE